MIVEPFANDDTAANHNPIGTDFLFGFGYGVRAVLAGAGGWDGAGSAGRAGEVGEGCAGGGFTHFRKATETPFNMVFEARG